ncbi:MAG: UvrD-helicase domain-containing protein, partial [Phototrophicaceae bacterium]
MTLDLLSGLNPQQYEAVTTVEGPVLVLAGPGSGKTGVLTRRVAHLISDIGVAPYQIMAVTFTNKAAAEMRHRVSGFLGERVRGLQIGTFHSTCARLLRIEADYIPYNQDYAIYDTDDQKTAVTQAMSALDIDTKRHSPRAVLSAISAAKNDMILPENYVAQDYITEIVSRVYPKYQETLLRNNAMDFDDLLVQMVVLLKDNQGIREKYQQRYPFVMVDEFQDTNTVQYQLVQLFAMPQNNIFVVGDEDQSIYAFRGADFRNVLRFSTDYPTAKVILLEQNYRSTQVILDTARAVIDKNHNRTPKALFTDRAGGDLITVKEAYDDTYEAQFIMEEIDKLTRAGYSYGDIAIMYRTNAQSRALEAASRNYNVPYHLVGGISFYQRREIKDMLAYLRIVNNPEDSVSFERVMKMQKGIGKKSLESFFEWLIVDDVPMMDAMSMLANGEKTPLSGRVTNLFGAFAGLFMKWREMVAEGELVRLYDTIRVDIDYTSHMHSYSEGDDQFNERLENITELRGLLSSYDEEALSLSEFLQDQLLMTDEDRVAESDDDTSDQVTMMTLHAAKGLEFPVVFITGLEEELLPHRRAYEEPDGIEEERRLFYVGITRAKDKLYISYAFRRALFGGYSDMSEKSGFLFDIPHEVMTDDSSLRGAPNETSYSRATTWERQKPDGLSRLARDLQNQKTDKGHISDEGIRGKIIPFPGGVAGSDPLKFKTGMQVHHAAFGVGTVIDSNRVDGKEIVDVA